jgi:hypothetical protein
MGTVRADTSRLDEHALHALRLVIRGPSAGAGSRRALMIRKGEPYQLLDPQMSLVCPASAR